MDSVTTISEPASTPARQLGSTMWKKRWRKLAPSEAAPSSSVFRSIAISTASTERTMKGSVNSTWPDQDEGPRGAEAAGGTIGDDQRQRGGEPRHRHRHHQQFLQRAGKRGLALGQHVGRGNAEHQRAAEAGERDADREEDGVAIAGPDLADPAQGQPALDADEIVHRQPGQHGEDHRHDQERADQQREGELGEEERAAVAHVALLSPRPRRCRRRRCGRRRAPSR